MIFCSKGDRCCVICTYTHIVQYSPHPPQSVSIRRCMGDLVSTYQAVLVVVGVLPPLPEGQADVCPLNAVPHAAGHSADERHGSVGAAWPIAGQRQIQAAEAPPD